MALSRTITGLVIIFFASWFLIFAGIIDGPGIDYFSIFFGLVFIGLGVYVLLNKKEDEIERRKDK